MNAQTICTQLQRTVPSFYECVPAPIEGVRISTPLLFPDGDVVDVFVLSRDDEFVITDFGCALGWLRNQSIRGRLTSGQRRLLNDVCMTLDVELDNGQIRLRLSDADHLVANVQRLAQAVVRVADLWFTFRAQTWETLSDEVDAWLKHRSISYEHRFQTSGRSGRRWTVDYKTMVGTQISLVFLLTTGARGSVPSIVNRTVTGCIDLANSASAESAKLVSLFDDTLDMWRDEDFALLENVSEIAQWSNPEEFAEILTTPVGI